MVGNIKQDITENVMKGGGKVRHAYENVELIRKHKGITKKKMAENANISTMTCTRLLTGKTTLSAELLRSFSSTLAIDDIDIFFNDKLTDSVISRI